MRKVLPIYVINLDDDRKRLAAMRDQLDKLGLPWERISAVDGAYLSPSTVTQENRRIRQRKLCAEEIGCLYSHIIAWRRIAEGQDRAGLVLEDDLLLATDMAPLVKDPAWLHSDDCIVRLETFARPVVLGSKIATVYGRGLYPQRSIHYGSAAYIITPERARAMLRAYRRYVDTVDDMMFRYPRENRVYQFSPAPCIQHNILNHARRTEFSVRPTRLGRESARMMRQSWCQPRDMTRCLALKAESVFHIMLDIVRGYPMQVVPYDAPADWATDDGLRNTI